MKLLVVRTGINWEEEKIMELKESLIALLPNFKVIVLHGENDRIETKFEIINLD